MADAVLMPQAGQSMTEGTIVEWLVAEGGAVARGDPLVTIETDKASMDIEAPAAGVLRKVFHEAGAVVPVLEAIAVIGAAAEEIDFDAVRRGARQAAAGAGAAASPPPARVAPPPPPAGPGSASPAAARAPVAPAEAAKTAAPVPRARPAAALAPRGDGSGRPPRSSPLARRLARVRGIDLGRLRGSGPQGRIIRRDVEAAASTAGGSALASAPALPASASTPYPPPSPRPPARVPLEGMRKAIATALQRSNVDAPHFYLSMEIDVTAALALRQELRASGLEVSVNDLVVRAAAIALVDEPRVNCRVLDDAIEHPAEVNIGVAVGLDEGLVVPVVLGAHERDLAGIAAETRRIIDAARQGKLVGMGQGTFTVSNLGMYGVDSFTAIINPPEGAILAVGAATPRLVPLGGGFFPRSVLTATLSADHRAIDGLLAARFMSRLRHLLESPERLAE